MPTRIIISRIETAQNKLKQFSHLHIRFCSEGELLHGLLKKL
jgi:hypothetical protein